MVRQIRLILCLFCAGLVFMPFSVEVHAEPAQITASVDRKSLSRDQSLQLSILIQGEAHGHPDISPLEKSFEIVSSGQSSSYSFVNGRQHRETQLSYTLFPRHAGKLVIPSLKVGDLHTEPIEITVSDSSADPLSGSQGTKKPDIWLEATLDQDSVYVQQQLILTLRIYQGVNLAQAQLSELKIPEVLVKPFGKDRQYQENRNGRVWTVTERRYALFPQKSGTMNIPAVRLEGQAVGSSGNFFFSRTRPIRARSTDLSVEVLPIPNEWQQSYWLPASDLTLMDSWSADEFRVGESVTRKLKIVARGLLSSQLPPLFEEGGITGHQRLKFYTESARMQDTNDSDDWQGVREESMAILPTQSGDVTLPEIRVMWWDTDENKARQAIIPAKVIHITAPAVSRNQTDSTRAIPLAGQPEVDKGHDVELAGSGSHANFSLLVWRGLAILGLSGWLVALWLWRRIKGLKPVRDSGGKVATQKPRFWHRRVLQAARVGDGHACEAALLRYFSLMSGKRINNLLEIQPFSDTELSEAISGLEQYLYGKRNGEETWNGQSLAGAFRRYRFTSRGSDHSHHRNDLLDLYPSP